MSPRLKVLISAYACEPNKGSEPGVGWNWVVHMSKHCDLWVITRANNEPVIRRATESVPLPCVNWVYYDLPAGLRFWKQGSRRVNMYYYLWQLGIYPVAKRLHRQVRFDVIHHVTFGKYWIPSYLAFLSAPFVWGPVGAGETAPTPFYGTYSVYGRLCEHGRDLCRLCSEFNPLHRAMARRVAFALATTEQTARRLRRMGISRVQVMPQFAMTGEELLQMSGVGDQNQPPADCTRFISVGRNVHWKGFHLGLMAFAKALKSNPQMEYLIVNTGPDHQFLRRLAVRLGVADKVRFLGKLGSLGEVYVAMARAHALVHPALHEAFGNVVLESLALGRPVICLDLGGPALQVTDECGFKIPAVEPEQTVQLMSEAMLRLAGEADLWRRMGQKGRERVRTHFDWLDRVEQMRRIYAEAVAGTEHCSSGKS